MTKKGKTVIPRTTTMAGIAKRLPDGPFNNLVLREAISQCGIGSRQSIDGYIGDLLLHGWITQAPPGRFQLSTKAQEPGEIKITVDPAVRVPEVLKKLEHVLEQVEYVTIEEGSNQTVAGLKRMTPEERKAWITKFKSDRGGIETLKPWSGKS